LQRYADIKAFPIIPCNLCGSQENLQRQNIKGMLVEWEKQQPGRVASIFGAIQNIAPSQLADTNLFGFKDLHIDRSGERAVYPFAEQVPDLKASEQVVQIMDVVNN
jgi:tRNA 2-thiocytidine biosynthesis protein TtcA